jgi:Leucine-rich repeat (LRR) protein
MELQELTLINTGVSNFQDIGTTLSFCPALNHLRISSSGGHAPIDYKDTFKFVFMKIRDICTPELTDIDFSDCCLGVVANQLAQEMPLYLALTKLDLSGNKLYRYNGSHFDVITALPECHRLQQLDLSNNELNDRSGDVLALTLPTCTSLTHLDLSCNTFGIPGNLARTLPLCTVLRHLSLRNNAGLHTSALGDLLVAGGCSHLTCLNVSGCRFFLSNMVAVAPLIVLCVNGIGLFTNLTELNLSRNRLGDGFTQGLVTSVLPACTEITRLDLTDTDITDAGVRGLSKVIWVCPKLVRLGLTDNRLGPNTRAKIRTNWNEVHAPQTDVLWM